MPTAVDTAELRAANDALTAAAANDLADFWSALSESFSSQQFSDAILGFFPDLVASYGDTAAVIAADWYNAIRPQLTGLRASGSAQAAFRALPSDPIGAEQAAAAARWAMTPMFQTERDPTQTLINLSAVAQRLIRQPGRDTIWDSAMRDPVRVGVARVPRGDVTCRFCVMLASRGAVYHSVESAGGVVGRGSTRTGLDANGRRLAGGVGGGVKARGKTALGRKYHNDCDCDTVIVRTPADYPDGYDLDRLRSLYQDGAGIGRDLPDEN